MDTEILRPLRLEEIGQEGLRLRRPIPVLAVRRGGSYRVALARPFVTGVGRTLDEALDDLRGAIGDLYRDLRAKGARRDPLDGEVWEMLDRMVEGAP